MCVKLLLPPKPRNWAFGPLYRGSAWTALPKGSVGQCAVLYASSRRLEEWPWFGAPFLLDRRRRGEPSIASVIAMPSTVKCPACQKRLSVPSKKLGQVVACPACKVDFTASTHAAHAAPPPIQSQVVHSGFQCPKCLKPMDISGCTPGQTFLCCHCNQPFVIPGESGASSEQTPAPPVQVQVQGRNGPVKRTKFTDGLGEFIGALALMGLAMAVAAVVLPALGIDINRLRVKIIGYVLVFLFIAAASAIQGVKKLLEPSQIPAVSSTDPAQTPLPQQASIPPGTPPCRSMHGVGGADPASLPSRGHANDQWWLAHAGQVSGPFSTPSVVHNAQAGQFAPDARICRVGDAQWVTIPSWLKGRAANFEM